METITTNNPESLMTSDRKVIARLEALSHQKDNETKGGSRTVPAGTFGNMLDVRVDFNETHDDEVYKANVYADPQQPNSSPFSVVLNPEGVRFTEVGADGQDRTVDPVRRLELQQRFDKVTQAVLGWAA